MPVFKNPVEERLPPPSDLNHEACEDLAIVLWPGAGAPL
jgi:hypothetical protein